jgi:hypothetical protein
MTPDVNVLVAASRADHPHHQTALTWLTQAMAHARTHADLRLLGTGCQLSAIGDPPQSVFDAHTHRAGCCVC